MIVIEGGLTAIAVALAFCWRGFGSRFFTRIERVFAQLARRQSLAVATVGATAFLLRIAILPLNPIPSPFILDSFSHLLAGDTFASGRLTNPTPAMWTHFETFHITMRPTYMSMHFPAQGMVLAAGKVLAGHPWYGVLFSTSLMCAAICWMLQAWLPPRWALLGGLLAVLRLGLFSYWINTYSGGGSIAALGGALVLGAFPRFMRSLRLRYGLLLAAGVIVLANSRPFEGILLCLPVCIVLGRRLFLAPNKPSPGLVWNAAAAPLALIILAGTWMGYYNYRVFGNPVTLPYTIDRATYAIAPHFVWQPRRPVPAYRHAVMHDFYSGWELDGFRKLRTVPGFLAETSLKLARSIVFFAAIALLPPLIMLPRVLRDHRTRFLLITLVFLSAGMLVETWLIPHYLSPFTAAFYAIGLQAMRHLRLWKPGGQPTGVALVRLIVTVCVLLAGLRTFAEPLHLRLDKWPTMTWYGSKDFGRPRARVAAILNQLPGRQLAIVRYSPGHNPLDEWVYNAPDTDSSRVVWAREMGGSQDLELIRYYQNRKTWLVEPDKTPAEVSPYTAPLQQTVASR